MRNKQYPSSQPPQPKRPLQLRVSGEIYERIVRLADGGPVGSIPVSRVADRALELGVAQLEAHAQHPDPVIPLNTRGTDDAA